MNSDAIAPSTTDRPARNPWVEIVRIGAAFAIVWYHSSPNDIAYAGLSAFVILAAYFEARRPASDRLGLIDLVRRIGLPWAAWFSLYACWNIVRHQAPVPSGVLYGSEGHLWYLPFIFAALVLIRLARRSAAWPLFHYLCAAGAIGVLLTIPQWRPAAGGFPLPVPQYAQALAPILIGVFLAAPMSPAKLGLGAALFGALVYAALLPFDGVGAPHLIGALFVTVALTIKGKGLRVEPLSGLTFGIYLIHPFVLVAGHMALPQVSPGPMAVVGFALSLVAIWAIRRTLAGRLIT